MTFPPCSLSQDLRARSRREAPRRSRARPHPHQSRRCGWKDRVRFVRPPVPKHRRPALQLEFREVIAAQRQLAVGNDMPSPSRPSVTAAASRHTSASLMSAAAKSVQTISPCRRKWRRCCPPSGYQPADAVAAFLRHRARRAPHDGVPATALPGRAGVQAADADDDRLGRRGDARDQSLHATTIWFAI